MAEAFLVPEDVLNEFYEFAKKGISLGNCVPVQQNAEYGSYNREYPWAVSCQNIESILPKTIHLPTGRREKTTNFFGKEIEMDITKEVRPLQPLSFSLGWYSGYDASNTEPVVRQVPIPDFISKLQLKQSQFDCVYLDKDNRTAVLDTKLWDEHGVTLVRKDLMDSYIRCTGQHLIWLIHGENTIYPNDSSPESGAYCPWNGCVFYENNIAKGEIKAFPDK